MKERDMRPAVVKWLESHGLMVMFEFRATRGYIDVVGYEFAVRTSRRIPELLRAVAVELKLEKVGGVLGQARENRTEMVSWAAMPRERIDRLRPATLNKFRQSKVGLLAVGDRVHVVVRPCAPPVAYSDRLKKKLWRRHRNGQKGGEDENT